MNALLWTLSIILATIYIVSGSSKLVAPRERLLAVPGMRWIESTPMERVRTIDTREIAGARGLIVPWASGILPLLTPLAAAGLAAVQLGAMWRIISRGEPE